MTPEDDEYRRERDDDWTRPISKKWACILLVTGLVLLLGGLYLNYYEPFTERYTLEELGLMEWHQEAQPADDSN